MAKPKLCSSAIIVLTITGLLSYSVGSQGQLLAADCSELLIPTTESIRSFESVRYAYLQVINRENFVQHRKSSSFQAVAKSYGLKMGLTYDEFNQSRKKLFGLTSEKLSTFHSLSILREFLPEKNAELFLECILAKQNSGISIQAKKIRDFSVEIIVAWNPPSGLNRDAILEWDFLGTSQKASRVVDRLEPASRQSVIFTRDPERDLRILVNVKIPGGFSSSILIPSRPKQPKIRKLKSMNFSAAVPDGSWTDLYLVLNFGSQELRLALAENRIPRGSSLQLNLDSKILDQNLDHLKSIKILCEPSPNTPYGLVNWDPIKLSNIVITYRCQNEKQRTLITSDPVAIVPNPRSQKIHPSYQNLRSSSIIYKQQK